MRASAARFLMLSAWLVMGCLLGSGGAQTPLPSVIYKLAFKPGEAIGGFPLRGTLNPPFSCTSDGTAFLDVVLRESMYSPPIELLLSVSLTGDIHEFRLDRLTELHDVMQKGYFAWESGVAFLVIASREDKPTKEEIVSSDGSKHEIRRNTAERHDYVVVFDRNGEYKRLTRLNSSFPLQKVAVLPSGAMLAYGFSTQDHTPQLAMLNEDGTLLKIIDIPKGTAPASVFRPESQSKRVPPALIKPIDLVPFRDSIIVLQKESRFPLISVNESGAVRIIRPKLERDQQVDSVISSDETLHAIVRAGKSTWIDELDEEDGAILKQVDLPNTLDLNIACVHEGKFLAFRAEDGNLMPLVGTVHPMATKVSAPHQ